MISPLSAKQPKKETAFTFRYRVYYEDTDAGGIVYHGKYLAIAERARGSHLEYMEADHMTLQKDYNIFFVVRECTLSYKLPIFLGDWITIETYTDYVGKTSMDVSQKFFVDSQHTTTLKMTLVCVNTESKKPVRIPDLLKNALLTEGNKK